MSHQQVSTTLEKLVTSEVQEGTRQSTACLVRLIRYVSPHYLSQGRPLMFRSVRVSSGLLFTCRALENMQADHTSELRACFRQSYDEVLRHHHGWLVQSAVTVRVSDEPSRFKHVFIFVRLQLAIRAVPSRSEFYRRLSQGAPEEKLDAELSKWLRGLNEIVVHMKRFLDQGGYGTV